MKKILYFLTTVALLFTSCGKGDDPKPVAEVDQTVFMYLPWASDLLSYFQRNISDFESAIATGILKNERVIVFISTSATEAEMFELKYRKGECVRVPVKTYSEPPFTTAAGITSILKDVTAYAPASRYGMIIGCHGMGWVPVNRSSRSTAEKEYWEYEGVPLTRWFGGTSSLYQTDITTLAEGISKAGLKMEYILFDDCYMSSIEAAYDLRNSTDYLIACPTEVMAFGMPYSKIAKHLVGKVDYKAVTDEFLDFYSTYDMPCGTIAVTVCSEMNKLAAVMKKINQSYTFDPSLLDGIQRMDGYNPARFFDMGSYVSLLCRDAILLAEFEAEMERTVPSAYRKHTSHFYTMSRGKIYIDTFSGTTISDPSISSYTSQKNQTAWYSATH